MDSFELNDRLVDANSRPDVTASVGSTVHSILKVDEIYIVDTQTREILLDAAYCLAVDDAAGTLKLLEAARDDDRDVGDGRVDDTEDGARARIVEEGVVAWLFGRATEMDFFEGQGVVAFDLLKTIGQFVRGFEVEKCPLRLWERAILMGYDVFRQVQGNGGGIVIGNCGERILEYRKE